jgi:hypothetical protein
MSAMPSPMQADFSGSLPVKPPLDSPPLRVGVHPDDVDDGPHLGEHMEPARHGAFGFFSLLMTFCIGVAVTVGWYWFGGPVRDVIAGASPELAAWLAPPAPTAAAVQPAAVDPAAQAAPVTDQQQPSGASLDLDAVRQSVDRIAASQEQIKRSIDQLSVGQDQLTKEIAKLQAVEQYILYKNSEPPSRSAPAPAAAAAPARRPPAAPMPLAPPPQTPQAPAPH